MYVKMVRRTEVPSLMGTRIFSFAGVPKNDLILLHPTTEFKSCHFFCLSLVKFNQVHIAYSSYRNQTLLKDNFKKFWFATLWVALSFYWYLCWFFCSRFYFHTLVICTMVGLEPNPENDPNANMVVWNLKTNSVRSKTYDFQFILLENHTLSGGERNSE